MGFVLVPIQLCTKAIASAELAFHKLSSGLPHKNTGICQTEKLTSVAAGDGLHASPSDPQDGANKSPEFSSGPHAAPSIWEISIHTDEISVGFYILHKTAFCYIRMKLL